MRKRLPPAADLSGLLSDANQLLEGRQARDALTFFDRILELEPHDRESGIRAYAHFGAAQASLSLGDREAGREHFRAAFRWPVSYLEAGLRLGEMLLADGEAHEACVLLEEVVGSEPGIAEAHYQLAAAYLQRDERELARACAERALAISPTYPAAVTLLWLMRNASAGGRQRNQPRRHDTSVIWLVISPFLREWLGGQIYVLNLIRSLGLLPAPQRPRVIVSVLIDDYQERPAVKDLIEQIARESIVVNVLDAENRALLGHETQAIAETCSTPSDGPDVVFPILYPCWPASALHDVLFWIPDFQHRYLSENFSLAEWRSRENDLTALASRDVSVILSSNDALGALKQSFPHYRCRPHVWHFHSPPDIPNGHPGAPSGYADLQSEGAVRRDYFCCPNQIRPGKGYETLFHAVALLRQAGDPVCVVCTGGDLRGQSQYHLDLEQLVANLHLEESLVMTGVLPRSEQLDVMRRSRAIVQPSHFEGWSTVIEDARMIGKPVIATNLNVHYEQEHPRIRYFQVGDPVALAAELKKGLAELPAGWDSEAERCAVEEARRLATRSAREFVDIVSAAQGR